MSETNTPTEDRIQGRLANVTPRKRIARSAVHGGRAGARPGPVAAVGVCLGPGEQAAGSAACQPTVDRHERGHEQADRHEVHRHVAGHLQAGAHGAASRVPQQSGRGEGVREEVRRDVEQRQSPEDRDHGDGGPGAGPRRSSLMMCLPRGRTGRARTPPRAWRRSSRAARRWRDCCRCRARIPRLPCRPPAPTGTRAGTVDRHRGQASHVDAAEHRDPVAVPALEVDDRLDAVLEGVLGVDAHVTDQIFHQGGVAAARVQAERHAVRVREVGHPFHPGEDVPSVDLGRHQRTAAVGQVVAHDAGEHPVQVHPREGVRDHPEDRLAHPGEDVGGQARVVVEHQGERDHAHRAGARSRTRPWDG